MRNWLLIGFLVVATPLVAQWKDIELEEFSKAILEVENRIPQGESYSYEAIYLFFEEPGSTDTTLMYDFSISVQSEKQLLNMLQFGREMVQNKSIQVVCDPEEKQLIVNYPTQDYFQRKSMEDYSLLLKSECTAQKKTVSNQTVYYLKFAEGARYSGVELWIENGGMVTKYIMYTGIDVLDDTGETDRFIHPRMEIHFSDYTFGKKVDQQNLQTVNKYFSDITSLIPNEAYKDFEIIDLRNSER